jgi:hypothetical protein
MVRPLPFVAGLALVAQASAVAFSGCSLDDVGLEGKACPCVAGYVCDVSANRCVTSLADVSGGLDAEPERDAPPGEFVVTSFACHLVDVAQRSLGLVGGGGRNEVC